MQTFCIGKLCSSLSHFLCGLRKFSQIIHTENRPPCNFSLLLLIPSFGTAHKRLILHPYTKSLTVPRSFSRLSTFRPLSYPSLFADCSPSRLPSCERTWRLAPPLSALMSSALRLCNTHHAGKDDSRPAFPDSLEASQRQGPRVLVFSPPPIPSMVSDTDGSIIC